VENACAEGVLGRAFIPSLGYTKRLRLSRDIVSNVGTAEGRGLKPLPSANNLARTTILLNYIYSGLGVGKWL
jgi:hypothetical protein